MLDLNELIAEYVMDENGEHTAVIIPIGRFRELLEDIENLAAVAERRAEPTLTGLSGSPPR